jgi:TetR/AcrR family transcriptional regulator, lmrAB and yxaGH operons repressor
MAKDTRIRIIETTARLLQQRGYHGTSMNDILAESSAPRGSLYFHFPDGKDQIVLEATRQAIEETTQALRKTLADAKSPAQAVRLFLETIAKLMRESDYGFGCPVAPMILDGTEDLTALADLCRAALSDWTGILRTAFVAAGLPNRRARSLGLLVVASTEGAMLMARGYRDCGPLVTVAEELETVVKDALPRRRKN